MFSNSLGSSGHRNREIDVLQLINQVWHCVYVMHIGLNICNHA